MSDETYDKMRARRLEESLRELARTINELDAGGELLARAGEITRMIGDIRSELFHYEVRVTYDTPEVAESRRIVAEALNQQEDEAWREEEWTPESEDREE